MFLDKYASHKVPITTVSVCGLHCTQNTNWNANFFVIVSETDFFFLDSQKWKAFFWCCFDWDKSKNQSTKKPSYSYLNTVKGNTHQETDISPKKKRKPKVCCKMNYYHLFLLIKIFIYFD